MTFLELLKEGVITQAVISVVLIVTICVMAVMQMEIPDVLTSATMLVLGFYFGSQVQQRISSYVARLK